MASGLWITQQPRDQVHQAIYECTIMSRFIKAMTLNVVVFTNDTYDDVLFVWNNYDFFFLYIYQQELTF